jgi:ferritin-like metal-binding protein YciE
MELLTMRDLLVKELKDLVSAVSAERQILEALPRVIDQVTNEDLKVALGEHLEETKNQAKRLEEIGGILGEDLEGEECAAMKGLIREASQLLESDGADEVLDAAIIASMQRIEHYEIAVYGSARTFAEFEGQDDIAELLEETLDEEEMADEKLTDIAMSSVNIEAEEGSEEEAEDEDEELDADEDMEEDEEEEEEPDAPGRKHI